MCVFVIVCALRWGVALIGEFIYWHCLPVVGKHLQVLEVHQEVDTFKVLVGKKARFWLCYVIRKILDSLSNFVYVNEKFCNKNLF